MGAREIVCLIAVLLPFVADYADCDKLLSRRKRYLTFPEGASVTAAVCMTAQLWVQPPGIFTESIAWGLAYELPNDTQSFEDLIGSKHMIKRRNRRALYSKMETILDSAGYDGRYCVLRSICEATYRFLPKEDNLLHHILKIIFRYPEGQLLSSEPDEHHIYHHAAQLGRKERDCSSMFYRCPFSLIDMALGEYSPYLT
nr:unnamed protein product [Callosobruchus chinensis]